jgi:hypothetical protein
MNAKKSEPKLAKIVPTESIKSKEDLINEITNNDINKLKFCENNEEIAYIKQIAKPKESCFFQLLFILTIILLLISCVYFLFAGKFLMILVSLVIAILVIGLIAAIEEKLKARKEKPKASEEILLQSNSAINETQEPKFGQEPKLESEPPTKMLKEEPQELKPELEQPIYNPIAIEEVKELPTNSDAKDSVCLLAVSNNPNVLT